MYTIGIDIGGHTINSVLMKRHKVVVKRKVVTKSMSNKKIMIAQIFDCIDFLKRDVDKKKIKGIGIGIPSAIDFKRQKTLNAPNVTSLKNTFLAKIVQEHFKIKALIDNDANCFGLAEALLGAGRGNRILAGLTLGTGLGGAIVIDRKIFRGTSGSAAEFGHMIVEKGGRKCSCGSRGCLEAYVSARGMVKTARDIGSRGVSPKEFMQLAKKGDKKAIRIYQITGEYLGIGLASIINILNPNIIVIGGGIANVGKILFDSTKKVMKKNTISFSAKNTKIAKAKFGEDAGAIGAALLLT